MSIPASVTLYANWVHGTLSAGTYTQASPEVPNGHTWTFTNSTKAVHSESPWNGQTLAEITSWNSSITTTVSSSTVQATSGRFLLEFNELDSGGYVLFMLRATTEINAHIWALKSAGNLKVQAGWNNDTASAEVDLGTYPTGDFALEIIYDFNNATSSQRLRARTWAIGGSPGSMVNGTALGSAAAGDQFTSFTYAYDGESGGLHTGRAIFSNSTSEDLSLVSESSGPSIPVLTHHLRQQGVQ